MVSLILDVGCGVNPAGDVNVDLPLGADYAVEKTKANVYASAYHLPFREGAFEIVRFNGLLHHLSEPERAWKEMKRVASTIVIGVEPNFNLFLPRDKTEAHHLYRKRTLQRIVGNVNVEIRREVRLARVGKVNGHNRTRNWFPIVTEFLIIGNMLNR